MKKIFQNIYLFAYETDKRIFFVCSLLMGIGIYLNYSLDINQHINQQTTFYQFIGWYLLFLFALSSPYLFHYLFYNKNFFEKKSFLLLIITSPLLFAWKMSAYFFFTITVIEADNIYWNRVLYWPIKLCVILTGLILFHQVFDRKQRFYGTDFTHFNARPYLIMLLLMIPLVALASTQPDFLEMYPKLQHIVPDAASLSLFKKMLFELSYGSDFIGIELYFRGFLILAFAKWVGKDAILPMAMFYCTIHFGKPLGECISSFFGGLILGVVTYHTRNMFGGLLVHLGIAWLMELGGYIGNAYYQV